MYTDGSTYAVLLSLQKQSFSDVRQNEFSYKFRKCNKKTPTLESLFNKVAGLQAQLY